MSQAVRKLSSEEVVIGFVRTDGKLIGEFVDYSIGHNAHSYSVPGHRSRLVNGQAIAVTIGKTKSGEIRVLGSGAFPPPGGKPLNQALKDRVRRLVE